MIIVIKFILVYYKLLITEIKRTKIWQIKCTIIVIAYPNQKNTFK